MLVNKVIIIGHRQASNELVESVLCRGGMKIGSASRREGLYPRDITTLLRDTHGICSAESSIKPEKFCQIEPAAMWNLVLLDLAIGNSEHTMWGWSDCNAIILVDFWLKNDPHASIVFVYEEPASLIDHNLAKAGEEAVHHQLENWAAYNTEMLRVFSKHKDRCVLVSIHRMQAIPGTCQRKLNMALDLSKAASATSLPQQNLQAEELGKGHEEFDRLGCAAKQYVAATYLRQTGDYEHLYDQLQSAADLPDEIEGSSRGDYKAIWESLATSPQLLAIGYWRIRSTLVEYQARQRLESGQYEDLFLRLQQSMEEVEECRLRIKWIAGEVAAKERLAAKKRIRQELRYRLGDTLISCSRSPRGWFRMAFALVGEIRRPTRKTRNFAEGLSNKKNLTKRDKKKLAIKQQLSYRLGSKLVKHARSPIGWVTLPFAIIYETIAFKQKRRRTKSVPKTKISHTNGQKPKK